MRFFFFLILFVLTLSRALFNLKQTERFSKQTNFEHFAKLDSFKFTCFNSTMIIPSVDLKFGPSLVHCFVSLLFAVSVVC
jgi:hypothetical protein